MNDMPQDRPSWTEYFMDMARLVATRSTCLRRKVGAVIVKDNRILATGYNGAPSGVEHCNITGCLRERMGIPSGERHEICVGAHGEANAIAQAARFGIVLDGATIYCTTKPCSMCAKSIVQAGIRRVVYAHGYPDEITDSIFRAPGIEVEQFNPGMQP